MDLSIRKPVIALQPGEVITLDDAAGTRVAASCGTVWVTEEGSPDDHIVGPGESIVLARAGRTVVQALQPSWVELQ